MADLTPQQMATKPLAGESERGPSATDPTAATSIVVTLDQLRPYDHNPRVGRNPAHDDIKASIHERGLDAPPAITRRPGEAYYIIRSGGNTRLAILRELWDETHDERFFRITCMFRPWLQRGEIVLLTGHLAENELRGGLSFIERALGIEKVREYHERQDGKPISQSELARRLAADGFPVSQSSISRMQDAVRYLLPAIPTVLYGGLGRHQAERLVALHKAGERIFEKRAEGKPLTVVFATLFQGVLEPFDVPAVEFSPQRVQDELIGQMADLLQVDYDTLRLEMDDSEARQRVLTSVPAATCEIEAVTALALPSPPSSLPKPPAPVSPVPVSAPFDVVTRDQEDVPKEDDASLHAHIISEAPTTQRLQSIQRLVAGEMGDSLPDFEANVLRAIPVQVGGLYPISDVWFIEPNLDMPDRLRTHIAQFAREIAEEAKVADYVQPSHAGIGFVCASTRALSGSARAVLLLLQALSGATPLAGLDDELSPLLRGSGPNPRLSDAGLVKLFRLLRLARRLLDLEASAAPIATGHSL
ncbi:MAG: ParB family protein [Burkholderiaceae bacterium]|nr:ParB family protein [Burkholderiaceae bacterium]